MQKKFYYKSMALYSLMSGAFKNIFFSLPSYFSSHLASLQTAKTIFIKFAALWLFNSNLNPTNTLHRKTNTLDKIWFQILLFWFSHRQQLGIQWLCNHSIIQIISFSHSSFLFFTPQFLSLGDREKFLHVIAVIY